MKIQNSFHVAQPPDRVWQTLNDIERIAPCLPGAELLESKHDGSFIGRVNVRLGPVALAFKGNAAFEKRDDQTMTARVKASGNEERARGTARATSDFAVRPADSGGTVVEIDTDLTLAGSIAQYARGVSMIETTAQVLIDDFANNLEKLLESDVVSDNGGVRSEMPSGTSAAEATEPVNAADRSSSISGFSLLWRVLQRWFSPSKADHR